MPTNQGDRQAFFRAISDTTSDYNSDFLAAAAVDGFTGEFNGVFIQWLQDRTGSSSTNLDGLKQEFAELAGAHNWESTGGVPIMLSGCQLWLDASDNSTITETGGKLAIWGDKSGNGNNATQATGANQPTRILNAHNGLPTIRSASAAITMALPNGTIPDGDNDVTIMGVIAYTSGVSFRIWIGSGGDPDTEMLGVGSTNKDFFQFTDVGLSSSSNVYTIDQLGITHFQYASTGTLYSLFIDGTAIDTATTTRVVAAGNNTIFDHPDLETLGIRNWLGDISEIAVFNKVLSSSERGVMTSYFSNKWGTP